MKDQLKVVSTAIILFVSAMVISSCSVIEGIFKAGVWTGIIIIVVLIIALIIFILTKIFKK